MSHNDEEYNDSIMLSESLERIAAQAMHLKEKIEAGLQLPSWAEYKVYQAYDAVNKALGTAYPGRYEMGDKKASVFDLVKAAAATFSPAMDSHPALKGRQSELPDKIQAGIIKKKVGEKKASVFDLVKQAGLVAMTYDPENPRIKALQDTHGPGWKKVWAGAWGLNEDQIQPIGPGGKESVLARVKGR
jgi:hypothetical protein